MIHNMKSRLTHTWQSRLLREKQLFVNFILLMTEESRPGIDRGCVCRSFIQFDAVIVSLENGRDS